MCQFEIDRSIRVGERWLVPTNGLRIKPPDTSGHFEVSCGGSVKKGRLLGHILVVSFLAIFLGAGSATVGVSPDTAARSSAADLASRLSASPPTSSWVSDASKSSAYQADVNQMAYLSTLLAGELANGKGKDETRGIYGQLRTVGLRILTRSKATGQKLPDSEVKAYEDLMSKLEAWYGPTALPTAQDVK